MPIEKRSFTKPVTINDVAGALGMHKSTVSLALSGKGTIAPETRRRVIAAAQELGYEPNLLAQRLAHGMGTTTVCLYTGVLDVGLTTEKILLVQKALGAQGIEAPIYTCAEVPGESAEQDAQTQAAQVRKVCRQRPRAIVCAAQRLHPAVFQELAAYQNAGGIVISYDTPVPLDCDQIIFDREDNAYQAARYLLEKGHRKIGIGMSSVTTAANAPGGAGNDPQSHRLRGFRRALAEFGAEYRDEWFFRNSTYENGGAEMAARYLGTPDRPTALAIVNDYVALAFMVEAMRAGTQVPRNLSVIGHDNQPIARYCPVPLTTMTQPTDQIASAVVERLLGRLIGTIREDDPPEIITVRGELIERASVSPCA